MTIKLDSFTFDRGIDRIIHGAHNEQPLPLSSPLPPSEAGSSPELDKLLALPNLRDYVVGVLRPQIDEKAILTPQGFQLALEDALALLRRETASSPDTAHRGVLDAAMVVLSEQADLRELINTYRSALFQG